MFTIWKGRPGKVSEVFESKVEKQTLKGDFAGRPQLGNRNGGTDL